MTPPLGHRRHRLRAAAAPRHQRRARRDGRHHPRMDRRADRDRGAPHRRRRRDHRDARHRGGAEGARRGRHRGRPDRPDRARHRDARPDLSGQRDPGADRARHRRLHRLRRGGGLHRLPLRALGRRQYDQGRHGRSRPGDRLGDVQPHPRLGGPRRPASCSATAPARSCSRPRRSGDRGILATRLHADGRHNDLLYVDGGVSTTGTVGKLRMKGKEVFRHAVVNLAAVLGETLEAAGHEPGRDRLGGAAPGQ